MEATSQFMRKIIYRIRETILFSASALTFVPLNPDL